MSSLIDHGDDAGPKKFHPSPDPANRGGWVLNEAISDEFEGQQLDQAKWYVEGKGESIGGGSAPSQSSPHNVRVQGGKLCITTKWDPDFEFSTETNPASKSPYEKYTTAAVLSNKTSLYG